MSLRQVAKRLGFSAAGVLKAYAPNLYERLKTHWQAYARIRRTELQNKLKAVLEENPPPFLRPVYSRLGVTELLKRTIPPAAFARRARTDPRREFAGWAAAGLFLLITQLRGHLQRGRAE